MFSLTRENANSFTVFTLADDRSGASAEIIPELGAMVNQVCLSTDEETAIPVIQGCNLKTELPDNPAFKGTRLFPFPNRVNKGRYRFQNEPYALEINSPSQGHAIHGFVYKMPFKVEKTLKGEGQFILELSLDYSGDYLGFPFPFKISIEYLVYTGGLTCSTTIKNVGETDMPFGDGWHPYFSFPDQKTDDLFLQLPECSRIEVDEHMIPTCALTPYDVFSKSKQIGAQNFDNGFRLNEGNRRATTFLMSPKHKTELLVWQENYPYLQIFTPPGRRSVAIEPMTCAADAFNNGMGLLTLAPGEAFSGTFGIILQKVV